MDFLRPLRHDGLLEATYSEIKDLLAFGLVDVFDYAKFPCHNERVSFAKITDLGIRELNHQIGIKK